MNPPAQPITAPATNEDTDETATILLIDDDHDMHALCRHYLEKAGYHFVSAYDGAQGLERVRRGEVALILLDLMLPDKDGFTIYQELLAQPEFKHVRRTPVIALTAMESWNARRQELLDAGVSMYLEKPFGSRELLKVIDNVLLMQRLRERKLATEYTNGGDLQRVLEENRVLRSQIRQRLSCDKMAARSPVMQELIERLGKVAKSEGSIFIHGERGTGKEFLARCIHANSSRAQGPFVAVDCIALPSQLLEQELWGYEKDAFAGAVNLRRGLLELAEGGTLFFDGAAELDSDLQTKLLRVLQDRQFHRLGGKYSLVADFRVISASVRDPLAAVKEKHLRHDLFYRLNAIPIFLPPLRARKEDIPDLCRSFLQHYAQANAATPREITLEAVQALSEYTWPGNVRELQQVLENLAARPEAPTIAAEDLPEHIHAATPTPGNHVHWDGLRYDRLTSLREARQRWVEQFERKYLIDLLNQYNGNISRVARRAGVHRMTIYRMLKNYDITITPRRAE